MLSRGVGLTSLQCVNLYPTVTSDPDPVTKVCWKHHAQVCGGEKHKEQTKLHQKNDKTSVYATKETIYLGYALPVQIKRP